MNEVNLLVEYNISYLNFTNIQLKEKIGEGKSGIIYKINDDLVIKILKNGNRFEYDFYNNFIEILKKDSISKKISLPIAYGNLLNNIEIDNETFNMENKFLILHKYKRFKFEKIKAFSKIGKIFKLINDILIIENFFETKLKFVNLDIKLDNIVMDQYNNIIMIDFGLIKNFSYFDMFYSYNNYFIWPSGKCYLDCVPLYSVFILICSIFFDTNFIKNKNIYQLKNILSDKFKNKKLNTIFDYMIKLKYNSNDILNFF